MTESDCLDRKQLALFGIKPAKDAMSTSPKKKVGDSISFATRYKEHEYESVKIDKNCASCRDG